MEQRKNEKLMLTIVGIAILVIGLIGVTYAFFNYTRTGSANVIKTGRIYFNSEQGTAINLTNMFPIDVTNGIPNDNTKVGTVTLNVTGDTTYDEGIEYLVSAVNVQNTIGSGANAKSLPISIDVSVTNNSTNDPATTLGTSNNDYYTNRGGNSSIYKVLAKDTISDNDQLLVGYITKGSTGVDGNIVIKAYLDKSKVAITDTYDGNETDNMGTTTEWVNDRVTFTTQEWNSLQANGVSFQIRVESNEGIWVKELITYNANGGTVSTTYKELESGATTYGELAIPTAPEGYAFDGWYTEAIGGTKVTASTTYTSGTSATTLYAHWNVQLIGADKFNAYFENVEEVAGAKRYTGEDVDNYVLFNDGELWRIIGIYNNQLKIVRASKLTGSISTYEKNKYNLNINNGNAWAGSNFEIWLNQTSEEGYYYSLDDTAKSMIVDGTWNAGAVAANANASEAYLSAQTTQITRKVGLLASYEYLYTTDSSCHNVAGNSGNFNPGCSAKTWFIPGAGAWTLSPYSNNSTSVTFIMPSDLGGYIDTVRVDRLCPFDLELYPVVYLNSSVQIASGQGTESNPYTLN